MENSITINGVKHVLVDDEGIVCTKESCSLYDKCNQRLCCEIFDSSFSHFEKES